VKFIRIFALLILPAMAAAQTGNTLRATQFPGSTVGDKVTAAQNACLPDTSIPCVIVLDPMLAVFPSGNMPNPCANCTWIDYRNAGVVAFLNGITALKANGGSYFASSYSSVNAAVNDCNLTGGNLYFSAPQSYSHSATLSFGTPITGTGLQCNAWFTGNAYLAPTMTDGSPAVILNSGSTLNAPNSGSVGSKPAGVFSPGIVCKGSCHVSSLLQTGQGDGRGGSFSVSGLEFVVQSPGCTDDGVVHLRGVQSQSSIGPISINAAGCDSQVGLLMDNPDSTGIVVTSATWTPGVAHLTVAASSTATPDGHHLFYGQQVNLTGTWTGAAVNPTAVCTGGACTAVPTSNTTVDIAVAGLTGSGTFTLDGTSKENPVTVFNGSSVFDLVGPLVVNMNGNSTTRLHARPMVFSVNDNLLVKDVSGHGMLNPENAGDGQPQITLDGNGSTSATNGLRGVDLPDVHIEPNSADPAPIGIKAHDIHHLRIGRLSVSGAAASNTGTAFDLSQTCVSSCGAGTATSTDIRVLDIGNEGTVSSGGPMATTLNDHINGLVLSQANFPSLKYEYQGGVVSIDGATLCAYYKVADLANATVAFTANNDKTWGFQLGCALLTSKVVYDVTTADNSANLYDLGVARKSDGKLMVHLGATAGTTFAPSTGFKTLSWLTSNLLLPGQYYFVYTTNAGTAVLAAGGSSPISFSPNLGAGTSAGGVIADPISPPADAWSTGAAPTAVVLQ